MRTQPDSANRTQAITTVLPVSVVIPTYNRAHTISRAVESVLNQTHSPAEIIVVDDGSTDNTEAILASYEGLTVIKQSNQGVSAARNSGITHAQSEWIAFLDSDDEWFPEKLHSQLNLISHHPDTRVCHCDEIWIRNGKRINPAMRHAKSGGWIYPECLPLCAISPSAVLINRDVFKQIGMFDPKLPACEDYDMWLRICSQWPVSFIDKPLLRKFGGHQDQLSKRYAAMDRFRIYALQKILRSNTLQSENQQQTVEILVKKLVIYLTGLCRRGRHSEAEQLIQEVGDLVSADYLRHRIASGEPSHV